MVNDPAPIAEALRPLGPTILRPIAGGHPPLPEASCPHCRASVYAGASGAVEVVLTRSAWEARPHFRHAVPPTSDGRGWYSHDAPAEGGGP